MMNRRELLTNGLGALAAATAVPRWLGAQTVTQPTTTQTTTAPATTRSAPRPIPTATGSILPSEMGFTSAHEHVGIRREHSVTQRQLGHDFAIAELTKAKALGLNTIVDVGPFDDPAMIREVSLATGVNVVCCTGFYQLAPHQVAMKVEEFEAKMLRDFEHGLGDTGIQPGVIKVACRGLPIKPGELNVFIAAARMQRKFDVPICTHSTHGCYDQQVILEAAGADLKRCYFSHIEAQFGWQKRTVEKEIDYLEQVVAKGSTLSFNNFGNWAHTSQANMAKLLTELVARGHDERIFATLDVIWDFKNGELHVAWDDINPDGARRTYGYLLSEVVPWMIEHGVPRASAEKFVSSNPQRIFMAG